MGMLLFQSQFRQNVVRNSSLAESMAATESMVHLLSMTFWVVGSGLTARGWAVRERGSTLSRCGGQRCTPESRSESILIKIGFLPVESPVVRRFLEGVFVCFCCEEEILLAQL